MEEHIEEPEIEEDPEIALIDVSNEDFEPLDSKIMLILICVQENIVHDLTWTEDQFKEELSKFNIEIDDYILDFNMTYTINRKIFMSKKFYEQMKNYEGDYTDLTLA